MIAKDCMSQQFSSPVPDHFLRAEPAIRGQGQSWETCAAPIGKGSDTTGKALPKLLECEDCGKHFEELLFDDDNDLPCCPECKSKNTRRLLTMPSPLKKNPFPYKVGPVNQAFVNNVKRAEAMAARGMSPCSSCGSSCAHAGGQAQNQTGN